MIKNLLKAGLVLGCVFGISTQVQAAYLGNPTISPTPNNYIYFPDDDAPTYMPGEINQITVTWPGTNLEITPDANIEVEDWVTWDRVSLVDRITVEGDKLIINYPLTLSTTYSFHFMEGAVKDKISGNVNEYIENFNYIISPYDLTSEWIVSEPATQMYIAAFGPTITLTVPGYTFTSVPDANRFKFTTTPASGLLNVNTGLSNDQYASAQSVTNNGESITINLGQTLDSRGWYGLKIIDFDLTVEDEAGTEVTNSQDIWLYYNVQGYSISPKDQQSFDVFPGLTIAGKNVKINNLDQIQIWTNYFEGTPEEAQKSQPELEFEVVGTASTTTETELNGSSGLLIDFVYPNGSLYNGSYTLYAPNGAITVDGQSIGAINWHFTIKNHPMPVPEVVSNPAEGLVTSINVLDLVWGLADPVEATNTDFYGEFLKYDREVTMEGQEGVDTVVKYVPATLTLPTGTKIQLMGTIKSAYIGNVTDDGAEEVSNVVGSYLQFVTNTTYRIPGKYVLTLDAGAVIVSINNYNILDSEPVTLEYFIASYNESPANGSTVEELDEVTLTWNIDVELNADAAAPTLNGEEIEDYSMAKNVLTLSLGELEDGEYVIVLPAGLVVGEGYTSPQISLRYNQSDTSAISSLTVDPENAVIYNLNGVRMDANKLTKGIYIINGRKVVVK